MSKRIIFFGNERLATGVTTTAPVLRALIAAGYEVCAVVVAQNESGPSRAGRRLEVAEVAAEHGIPLLAPPKLGDAYEQLAQYRAAAGVLVAYGKIVPAAVIALFPCGIVNIHPSLLPKHRGPTPIENAMQNGEPETGVSLMQLSSRMDAGPLYAQQSLPLQGNEIKQALAAQLNSLGKDLLLQHLPAILDGSLKPTPQDDSGATYDSRIDKTAGRLHFDQPAETLERIIRVHAGWPRSRCTIGNTEVIVTKAHVAEGEGTPGMLWTADKQLGFYTARGVLVIDTLIPSGKKEMTGQEFLAGYRGTI